MKTIIAGSRSITDRKVLDAAIRESGFTITEVVCGGALGVDVMGYRYAKANGLPIKMFVPDWDAHGRAAGPLRNARMAGYAEALIAVWDGQTSGTKDMLAQAKRRGLKVYVKTVDKLTNNEKTKTPNAQRR